MFSLRSHLAAWLLRRLALRGHFVTRDDYDSATRARDSAVAAMCRVKERAVMERLSLKREIGRLYMAGRIDSETLHALCAALGNPAMAFEYYVPGTAPGAPSGVAACG